MQVDQRGQVALVIGSSQEIGRSICIGLADAGVENVVSSYEEP